MTRILSDDELRALASEMLARGPVTLRAFREAAGGGDNTRLNRILGEERIAHAKASPRIPKPALEVSEMPEALTQVLKQVANVTLGMVAAAQASANERTRLMLASQETEHARVLDVVAAEIEQLSNDNGKLESEIVELEEQKTTASEKIAAMTEALSESRRRNEELEVHLTQERAHAQAEIARFQTALAAAEAMRMDAEKARSGCEERFAAAREELSAVRLELATVKGQIIESRNALASLQSGQATREAIARVEERMDLLFGHIPPVAEPAEEVRTGRSRSRARPGVASEVAK